MQDDSIPQKKILRVLKLISLLKGRSRRTPQELATLLETSDKSIYRYLKLLESLGFAVDKDGYNQYFIAVWDEGDSPSLTTEENSTLMGLMQSLKSHPLRQSIMGKLNMKTETAAVAKHLYRASIAKHTSLLSAAIEERKQVVLKKYQSASSGKIGDRLVEPFAFSDNTQYVLAYELESGGNKHFKLERIGNVVLTDIRHKHSKQHLKPVADLFGMAGTDKTEIILKLNLRPALLLQEEYPASEPMLSKVDNDFVLKCEVSGFGGIGRFILSNIGEVQVVQPASLKKYIQKKLEEGLKGL